MSLSRRQLIKAAGGAAAAHTLLPAVGTIGKAFGQTTAHPDAAKRNRLVVVFLDGGNDGLNTVVPTAGTAYEIYQKVRPTLALKRENTLPLTGSLGLTPKLPTLHRLWNEHRVAIVQGVDYPDHSYSHFTSRDIWHSGEPGRAASTGWIGRHLDRVGVGEGEIRGVGIGTKLPLMLRGSRYSGFEIASVTATKFADGTTAIANARHDALALFAHHPASEPLRRYAGIGARQAVDLVDVLSKAPATKSTGVPLADQLLTARTMLGLDLGVECVHVRSGGYDTHTDQAPQHDKLLTALDKALEVFFYGTDGVGALPSNLASRTTVLVVSEFGRRIGENGKGITAGTDHGAAAPVFVIGPKGRIRYGIHGEHPSMGSLALPADNLVMTTDVRSVYQALLDDWLHDPEPLYRGVKRLRLF